jgi:hypothetical protein
LDSCNIVGIGPRMRGCGMTPTKYAVHYAS